jgi:hypothetical protein
MAGAVGVSPWSYTWGELSLMAEGRDEADWWHTAGLMSVVFACVGVKRSPAQIHPYEQERNRKRVTRPEIQQAEAEANKAAWRAFCDTYKK